MEQRPRTVPVVAAFLFAATAIAAIVGASLLFPHTLLDRLWELNKPGEAAFRTLGWISGVFLLMLAVGTFSAAAGLLRRKKWAWWFAVALFGIDGCGDAVSFFATRDFWRSAAGVVISAGFLYFLSRRRVRRYFEQSA
ncbi:MAG TPA: hypothetical protein VLX58_19680 [Bryobacteraceae bacterium]|nr:hypothetical protein [Bryobacteraceae bacterium]HUJ23769.1 hypothetical protein [Bryobacteraceae bacterium]